MIRVAVCGAGGRMGATVCAAIDADDDLELAGAVDPGAAGSETDQGVAVVASLDDLGDVDGHDAIDVIVDFTVRDAARANAAWAAERGVHAVIGTSGFSDEDLATLREQFTSSNCLVAPNFAIGAVLMVRFAELAAPFFDTAEVIEFHHDTKIDAPSGTALYTAERMAAASSEWAADPTTTETLAGARGARGPGSIPVHAVRMRGMVAHQEVVLGTTGQSLVIRHDTTDRTSFMPGVTLACHRIADHPGVTVGLETYLAL